MNVKVIAYDHLHYHNEDKLYVIDEDFSIVLQDNNGVVFTITVKAGAKCDGLSIPFAFRWFLPTWNKDNELYNIAGIVHDGLYASELVCKNIADDIFRGILRDSGISRFKGSTAEWCVEKFAKNHYGKKHDTNNMKDYIELSL